MSTAGSIISFEMVDQDDAISVADEPLLQKAALEEQVMEEVDMVSVKEESESEDGSDSGSDSESESESESDSESNYDSDSSNPSDIYARSEDTDECNAACRLQDLEEDLKTVPAPIQPELEQLSEGLDKVSIADGAVEEKKAEEERTREFHRISARCDSLELLVEKKDDKLEELEKKLTEADGKIVEQQRIVLRQNGKIERLEEQKIHTSLSGKYRLVTPRQAARTCKDRSFWGRFAHQVLPVHMEFDDCGMHTFYKFATRKFNKKTVSCRRATGRQFDWCSNPDKYRPCMARYEALPCLELGRFPKSTVYSTEMTDDHLLIIIENQKLPHEQREYLVYQKVKNSHNYLRQFFQATIATIREIPLRRNRSE